MLHHPGTFLLDWTAASTMAPVGRRFGLLVRVEAVGLILVVLRITSEDVECEAQKTDP